MKAEEENESGVKECEMEADKIGEKCCKLRKGSKGDSKVGQGMAK